MQTTATELLNFLETKTRAITESANRFRNLSAGELNFKPDESSWSILQCFEHLNMYGDYYLPKIEERILAAKALPPTISYKSGWLGNYFANIMQVQPDGKKKKMNAPKDKVPPQTLDESTIQRFVKQQEHLLRLLKLAETVNLQAVTVPISIASFIKIQLGDCFRFVVNHNERHLQQAEKIMR